MRSFQKFIQISQRSYSQNILTLSPIKITSSFPEKFCPLSSRSLSTGLLSVSTTPSSRIGSSFCLSSSFISSIASTSSINTLDEYGKLLLVLGDYSKAIEHYTKKIQNFSQAPNPPPESRGEKNLGKEDNDDNYLVGSEEAELLAGYLQKRAISFMGSGDIESSWKDTLRCLSLSPRNPDANQFYFKILQISFSPTAPSKIDENHQRQSNVVIPEANDDRLLSLNDRIKKDPDFATLYFFRARIFLERKNFPKAIDDLSFALEKDPPKDLLPWMYYYRSVAYYSIDRVKDAIEDVSSSLSLQQTALGLRLRAKCYMSIRQYGQAKMIEAHKDLCRLVDFYPYEIQDLKNRMKASALLGKYSLALFDLIHLSAMQGVMPEQSLFLQYSSQTKTELNKDQPKNNIDISDWTDVNIQEIALMYDSNPELRTKGLLSFAALCSFFNHPQTAIQITDDILSTSNESSQAIPQALLAKAHLMRAKALMLLHEIDKAFEELKTMFFFRS
eukprot:TRINITY_DN355_c0_g1_i2.p1 TRINITY_DN355_c0_g1~~TRINITY_DN355_c0_g1_i2.p1  ORF type:complete len:517 (-),score=131.98 TRINITY_DN355_c0_g1_i2:808-2313(-)